MKYQLIKTLTSILTISLFLSAVTYADIVVIVNEKNILKSIKIDELQDFYMKRIRKWQNGNPVRFFDHRDENENRKIFLEEFIQKTSREVELYWIGEKIYTGNVAPIKITSDSMMTSMVSRFSGGIGYVSSKYKIPKTVKIIEIKKD